MDYLYDDSFYGLLTCIYENYYYKYANKICSLKNYQISALCTYKIVATDEAKAIKVYNGIKNKISLKALKYVYYVYLSNDDEKENKILNFLKLGFKTKKNILSYYEHPNVYPMCKIHNNVSLEVHRFLGILRFSEVCDILYCKYKPDNNITELLAPHFSDRLKNEKFIIHDEGRDIGAVSNNGKWIIADMNEVSFDILNQQDIYKNYWNEYFENIAIKERKKVELQYKMIPVRYRKNITEFNK
jgi:probable DNA metabolism protein